MLLKPIPSGKHRKIFRIFAICDDRGNCQTEVFLDGLGKNFEKDKNKILADMRKAAGHPLGARSLPPERCHDMDKRDPIFEFTGGTKQLRVAWFYDENKMIICSHSFLKKTRSTPESEKRIARTNRARYLEAKRLGQIRLLPEEDTEG